MKNFETRHSAKSGSATHTAFSLLEKFTAETDAEDPQLDHGWSLESIFVVRHSILRPSINRSLLCPPIYSITGFPSCTVQSSGLEVGIISALC